MTASPPALAAAPLAASVIRQSLIPMGIGYLLVMGALGLALIRLRRRRMAAGRPAPQDRGAGWPALARHAAATALGGYLLLMAVVFGYYYGVAKVSGDFLSSAVTGPALLLGVALPVFAAASWLLEWRRRRTAPRQDASGEVRQDHGTGR